MISARMTGRVEGTKGLEETNRAIARKMKANGLTDALISQIAGLIQEKNAKL